MNMKRITKRVATSLLLCLLIILLPILCLGSLTVLFSMGVHFLYERSGQYGKPVRMVKLRTMVNDDRQADDSERVTGRVIVTEVQHR